MERDQTPRRLAQTSPGPVADHRVADLLGGRKAHPGRADGRIAAPGLGGQGRAAPAFTFLDVLEFGPLAQARNGRKGARVQGADP